MAVIDEKVVRVKLSAMGFQKIRKRYGQRHEPIVSADKNGATRDINQGYKHYQQHSNNSYNWRCDMLLNRKLKRCW